MKKLTYGKQYIDNKDIRIVSKSLKANLITTGNYVQNFEIKIKKYLKSKFVLSCSSGTAGLDLAIRSIGVEKNDVVIMPAVNFIASYNLCKMIGAKIYFADVDQHTGQITPQFINDCIKKNKLKKIKLIICMQMGGYLNYVTDFYSIKKKYNCFLIDDACHAFGAKYFYKNKFLKMGCGIHSDISVFSSHPLKTITTGEGGIISTNNKKIYNKLKLLRSHGIVRNNKNFHWDYDINFPGLNYRLSDINCALGISQLTKIESFIKYRKKIFDYYVKLFDGKKNIYIPNKMNLNKSSYHLFLLNIDFKKINKTKDSFFKFMLKNKIICQFHYIPIYKFNFFKNKKFKLENSEKYFKNTVSLPIFYKLKKKEQDFISKKIFEFIN